MITVDFVRLMAAYNSEMNRRIYAGAARLTDAQRREDRGLFWKSLHGTLNHLLWADRQWMSRLDGWPPNSIPNPQSPTLVHDFDELRGERVKADAKIEEFARRIDDEWLSQDLVWFSGAAGREMRREKRGLMVHFFNHQTHHRGQAHAALTMCGVDPGDTDLFRGEGSLIFCGGSECRTLSVPPLPSPWELPSARRSYLVTLLPMDLGAWRRAAPCRGHLVAQADGGRLPSRRGVSVPTPCDRKRLRAAWSKSRWIAALLVGRGHP